MDYVDLGPKTEDLILEAQINFPGRKKKAHVHTTIHKPQRVLEEKKNRAWLVLKQSENQTDQIFITPEQIHTTCILQNKKNNT